VSRRASTCPAFTVSLKSASTLRTMPESSLPTSTCRFRCPIARAARIVVPMHAAPPGEAPVDAHQPGATSARDDARTRMGNGFRIGRIAGIDIRLDWSLAIVFTLVATSLAAGVFPAWHPDWPRSLAWMTAIAAALLFFTSVLVHELSHALVGRAYGMEVRTITLFVFGGLAHLEREPARWRGELFMALAGPVASLVIGTASLLVAGMLMGPVELDPLHPEKAFAGLGAGATLLFWLGQINILLALFNLVPGYPLDGGRVLRAVLWGITGNLRRATRWASMGGQLFAWMLMGTGIAMALGIAVPFFGTGLAGGVWLMLIGWFLNNAALVSHRQLLIREALHDVPVARLMRAPPGSIPPELPVNAFIDDYLMRSDQRAFPVIRGAALLGLACLADVRRLPREARERATVGQVMTPVAKLSTLRPGDDAADALARLGSTQVNQLPVIDRGRLVGMVLREDILKWLSLHAEPEAFSLSLGGRRAPQ
jgi:Zn-dependent protease/CBS domain-containing protein